MYNLVSSVLRMTFIEFEQQNQFFIFVMDSICDMIYLLDFAVTRAGQIAGRDGAPIHDASAVMAVVRPDLFRGATHPVDVELHGTLTRGMTVVDERPGGRAGEGPGDANALVLRDADERAVVDAIVDAVIALDGR